MASFKAGLRWRLCGCIETGSIVYAVAAVWLALAVELSWPIDRLPIALHTHAIVAALCHVKLLS